jgi:aminoglycoside phosphotransferase (APT) family kinase protein
VLKLYRPDFGDSAARYEAGICEAIDGLATGAPHFHGMLQEEGRIGLVFERVEGEILLRKILERPLAIGAWGRMMAHAHASLHCLDAPSGGFPTQRERLGFLIDRGRQELGPLCDKALQALDVMPAPRALCHGDYHPGNIFVSGGGLRPIDWMNSYAGDPAGDAARTYLMLAAPNIPDGMPKAMRPMLKALMALLSRAYLHAYLAETGIEAARVRAWLPIIAACRVAEHIPGEREWVLSMAGRLG